MAGGHDIPPSDVIGLAVCSCSLEVKKCSRVDTYDRSELENEARELEDNFEAHKQLDYVTSE